MPSPAIASPSTAGFTATVLTTRPLPLIAGTGPARAVLRRTTAAGPWILRPPVTVLSSTRPEVITATGNVPRANPSSDTVDRRSTPASPRSRQLVPVRPMSVLSSMTSAVVGTTASAQRAASRTDRRTVTPAPGVVDSAVPAGAVLRIVTPWMTLPVPETVYAGPSPRYS